MTWIWTLMLGLAWRPSISSLNLDEFQPTLFGYLDLFVFIISNVTSNGRQQFRRMMISAEEYKDGSHRWPKHMPRQFTHIHICDVCITISSRTREHKLMWCYYCGDLKHQLEQQWRLFSVLIVTKKGGIIGGLVFDQICIIITHYN